MKRILPDLDKLNNQDLLTLIREDQDNLALVYRQTKKYCLEFLKSKNFDLDDDELMDIFQDSIIVFYEKVVNDNSFQLTSSVKTYLCSVGYYKLLKKAGKKSDNIELDERLNYTETDEDIDLKIKTENESLYDALEKGLKLIKDSGGKCYDLLTYFWYQKKSMKELTEMFGYTNDQNTKNQKAKCQKRLEKLAYEQLTENR